AQSCCAHGTTEFARHWFHPRFLLVEGEKMSKSKGNFFTARELFDKHDPAAVRLELIKTHYRANANFTEQGLVESEGRIRSLRTYAKQLLNVLNGDMEGAPESASLHRYLAEFSEALGDDLNVSAALAALAKGQSWDLGSVWEDHDGSKRHELLSTHRSWCERAERLSLDSQPMTPSAAHEKLGARSVFERSWAALHLIDNILGVIFTPQPKQTETDIGLFTGGLEPDPAVIDKLIARRDAKKARDFAKADAIRDELAAMGYAIKDVAGGKVEVSRA
ncbi:MAG: hypothetical protein AAF235_10025, partial [Planctomycetota bacterium]